MTESPTIGRARRAARKLSRTEGMSHQQALDRIARESGHAHWSAMLSGDRSRDGRSGPIGSAASRPIDFLTDEWPILHLPTPETVAEWLRVHTPRSRAATGARRLSDQRMTPRIVAHAIDHGNGPWDDADAVTCRCPVHDDANPSLVVRGRGRALSIACMAGCPREAVTAAVTKGIVKAVTRTLVFMDANDRSLVYAGASIGNGGMGGHYTLADESRHTLDTLSCMLLGEDHPRWDI